MSRETLLNNVTELVKNQLKPLVEDIDRKGLYPEDFLRNLGAIGGFASVGSAEEGGTGYGLATQIAVLREVAKECGATKPSPCWRPSENTERPKNPFADGIRTQTGTNAV